MSFTPNRRLGFSLTPSPNTRSEKRPSDLRWADGGSSLNRHDREKEVNVQVMVRCRPLSDEEERINVQKVISCTEQSREVTVLQSVANRQVKAYTFDKVFGPKAQQRSIYDRAISPIVNDVLDGFNCTVFAYGQTGTGKTYTMEGVMKSKGGELSADAGVIPRAVRQIFDTLDAQKADYSMKVSFLELYNEEITDLLAPEDNSRSTEDKQRRPISLMEDGKGGAILRGLEEEFVYSANEIYSLLEWGSAKKRTADTLLNKQSSRSHSIFSITIHVKETTKGDEELLKCGRLNLVDLAGSENVSRSGVREGRAREAGELNKSLLTLGRVITALVEHSGHVPYRDSKLTRLLRESLGGKAKTCIIATVAPSVHCLEETLSTLDYAYRAKSIRNKPELNQKLSKSVLLKDLYLEIDRMKQDVKAAREKNGIYIPHERFAQDEAEKKAMSEKIDHLDSELYLKKKQVDKFQELYHAEQERALDLESDIKECRRNLEDANKAFLDLQGNYNIMSLMLKEKEFIISSLLNSENNILERAKGLRTDLESALEDISTLNTKIGWRTKIERENQGLVLNFGSQLEQSLKNLQMTVVGSVSQQQQLLRCIEEHLSSFIARKCEATKSLELRVEKIRDTYTSGVAAMKELAHALQNQASSDLEELKLTVASQTLVVENFLVTAVSEADQVLRDVQRNLTDQKQLQAFSAQLQDMGLERALLSTQMVSKTTIDFFNDLQRRVSRLLTILEENQTERFHQLGNLKKTFQEASAKEEKAALEKITGILANLSITKSNIVSKTIDDVNLTNDRGKTRLEMELVDMQHVSTKTQKECSAYIEKVESQLQEDTISATKTGDSMRNILQEALEKVGHSMQYWENAQSTVDYLNKGCAAKLEFSVDKSIQEINSTLEEFTFVYSSTNGSLDSGTCDLLTGISDSLLMDHEARRHLEPMSAMCMDQLELLKENNNKRIVNIRSQAENCLIKDYLVDPPSGRTPTKQAIIMPSLASIEALRSPAIDDLVTSLRSIDRLKTGAEGKQVTGMLPETPRSPFATIN